MELSDSDIIFIDTQLKECLDDDSHIVEFLMNTPTGRKLKAHVKGDNETLKRSSIRAEAKRRLLLPSLMLDLADLLPERSVVLINAATYFDRLQTTTTDEYSATLASLMNAVKNGDNPTAKTIQRSLLEEVTSLNPFIPVSSIRQWCSDCEARVCRVRLGTTPLSDNGTGFLLSEDLVLTCRHVVESLLNNRSQIHVFFDDGDELCQVCDEWPFVSSAELDFAVLKIKRGSEKKRGFYSTNNFLEPRLGEPVLIAGHPAGAPNNELTFSMASPGFQYADDVDGRYVYRTSTKGGHSGSPVFDRRMQVVAMHQSAGDDASQAGKANGGLVENNRGMPLPRILEAVFSNARWCELPEIALLKKKSLEII